jgi:putative thioredoxin
MTGVLFRPQGFLAMSTSGSPWVRDVTVADFEREVVEASRQRPVVVDFWAPWCAPCQALGPVLERLVHERNGQVLLAKVNTDEEQDLAAYFGIEALPSVKAVRDGRVILEFAGLLPEDALREFLDQVVPSEAERLLAEAKAAEADRPADAEERYRQVVRQDSGNLEARVGLARVLLAQGKPDEVEELLEPVGSEGELGAEAERLGARLLFSRVSQGFADEPTLRQRVTAEPADAQAHFELGCVLARRGAYPEALAELLAAAERDPKLAAARVREVMVQVFYALGANHPLANEYRAKLSRLLY